MHQKEITAVLQELGTSRKGLSSADAQERQQQFGQNQLEAGEKISAVKILLNQFNNFVVWILIVTTLISAFLGEYIDAAVILVILILIGVIGFIQEYRAEHAIEALMKLSSPHAIVVRNNEKKEIESKDLVPGDILLLEAGNKISADARLIESINLEVQEAALTGESLPVKKHSNALPEKTSLADRKNMVYAGTIVTSGRAVAVVTGIGMKTEIGKIAALMQKTEHELTPLQKKMDALGRQIGYIVIGISIVVFVVGLLLHKASLLEMLRVAASLAVAAIPEALPMVVLVTLAAGTQRMLKRNALIRRLPSVETLGSTTVICTDKTGTLTKNEMTVKKLFVNGKFVDVSGSGYVTEGIFTFNGKPVRWHEMELLMKIGTCCNDASLKSGTVIGDPTEGALIVSAAKLGMVKEELDVELHRAGEIGFTSERKMMTTIHEHRGEFVAYSKGAPDVLLGKCSHALVDGMVRRLSGEMRQSILDANQQFASHALRVLGFAYKSVKANNGKGIGNILGEGIGNNAGNEIEKEMIFVGLQGMIDPARDEIKAAIQKCHDAGIRVVMITGDHETTAKAVAKEIGLTGDSLTGQKLDEMEHLEDVVEHISIFARVNPEHKLKIIDALKKRGHTVAMTGDGVNDAPALKKADIGIAMGITGTDVAKEASSMILTDDNFASIVNAVEEGRGVYDNIRKYFAFLISGNIGEVLIIFLAMISGLPVPLTPKHLLLINLVTDGMPAMALSVDPYEPNAMSRKPRKQGSSIWGGLNAFVIYYPIALTLAALGVFSWIYFNGGSLIVAQTATFLVISFFELFQAYTCRSTIYPSASVGFFKNKFLNMAVGFSVLVIGSLLLFPAYGNYLDIYSPGLFAVLGIVLVSGLGGIIIEVSKVMALRKKAGGNQGG